jgi:hypothetical protein
MSSTDTITTMTLSDTAINLARTVSAVFASGSTPYVCVGGAQHDLVSDLVKGIRAMGYLISSDWCWEESDVYVSTDEVLVEKHAACLLPVLSGTKRLVMVLNNRPSEHTLTVQGLLLVLNIAATYNRVWIQHTQNGQCLCTGCAGCVE